MKPAKVFCGIMLQQTMHTNFTPVYQMKPGAVLTFAISQPLIAEVCGLTHVSIIACMRLRILDRWIHKQPHWK